MRRFNIWSALITGLPLGLLVAYGETRFDYSGSWGDNYWLVFILTAILSALVLGVPQGCLAAIPALHRGWWRTAALLVVMVIAGFLSTIGTLLMLAKLQSLVPTGEWVPLSPAPGRITALIGPRCDPRIQIPNAYAIAEDGRVFQIGWPLDWNAVDSIPAANSTCRNGDRASRTPPVPGGEVSRVIVDRQLRCSLDDQFALRVDGSIWRWEGPYIDCGDILDRRDILRILGLLVLPPVLSLVAWVSVIRSRRHEQGDAK